MRLTALLLLLLLLPAGAFAQGDTVPTSDDAEEDDPADAEDPAEPAEATGEADAAAPSEAAPDAGERLNSRLRRLVDRYYTGIGTVATEAEIASAIESIEFMLLDGVGLRRIAAGVDQAIRLGTPGRRTPFEVAVPLRIAPAAPGDDDASPPLVELPESAPVPVEAGEAETPNASAPPTATARTVDPETEKRWEEAQRKLKEKRSRRRLYRQWRDRTREKRALLSLGIPLLATGYAMGFGLAGASVRSGLADHAQGWAAAVPVVGTIAYMASTQITDPWPIGLSVLQGVGLGFVVAALTIKIDWPYDRDPMAITIPSGTGAPALTLRFAPAGAGGALIGTF